MQNIVTYREPKLKPLPPSVVEHERQKGVTLPARLEKARAAIIACQDLSELLTWKDQASAIAAAAKAAKMPDLARGANRVCKEALLRLGQLLSRYSSDFVRTSKGSLPSERSRIASDAGINRRIAANVVRFARAPAEIIASVLSEDRIPARDLSIAMRCPVLPEQIRKTSLRSNPRMRDQMRRVMSGLDEFGRAVVNGGGLSSCANSVKHVSLDEVRSLAPDEKKLVRAKVSEIMELLDAIDEACK